LARIYVVRTRRTWIWNEESKTQIMANLKINILAQDKTKGALRSVKGGLASIKNAVFSLKGAFVTLGTGVALRAIGNVASNFEDLRDSLTSVTGGVRQGAEAFNFITDFALRSQFSVENLTTSFITLKASGIEPTEKLLRVFTDTAAVTTDQLGTLDALTRVFSRGVQGGLGLEELNQIADRGVPIFRLLEEEIGITRLEISKFGQTTEGAKKILDALESSLGKTFSGATQQKLDNLSTSSSNLGIAFRNSLDVIGQAGFSGALTTMNNTLSETLTLLTPVAEALGKGLQKVVDKLTKALETLNKAIIISFDLYKDLREFLGIPLPDPPKIDIDKGTLEEATEEIEKQKNLFEKIGEELKGINSKRLKDLQDKFKNIEKTIAEGINSGITKMSQTLAKSFVFGEKILVSFKEMARTLLASVLSALIEIVARKGVELAIEKLITREKQKQAALSGASFFSSFSGAFGMKASGGAVSKGRPVIVGEQGAELFVPNSSGQITQAARGTNSGQTTVNFNINTLDASGFDELLIRNRGTITSIINSAVNERGSKNLI